MSNIFSSLKVYAEGWKETARRAFSNEEIASVSGAVVVDSQYGQSVCFTLVSGGMTYIPLDINSSHATGDIINLANAELVTLSRSGEADIMRISC